MYPVPFGGLVYKGGSANQFAMSLTTTALKLAGWSTANGAASQADSYSAESDPAVRPDATNNRIILNTPGIYLVSFTVSGVGGGTADTLWQGRINLVAISDLSCEMGIASTRSNAGFEAIVNVTRAQSASLATFGAPAGTFTGGAGAPQTETILDVVGSTLSGSQTFNVEYASLAVLRLG